MKKFFMISSLIQFIIAFFIGAGSVYFLNIHAPAPEFIPIRGVNENYSFINPLIGFDISADQDFPELTSVKSHISDLIDQEQKQHRLVTASVYIRTLKNGHWVGLNENKTFYPASLFKVPLMIAYFKKAESTPSILTARVTYRAAKTPPESAREPISNLVSGTSYTIDDLIKEMIVYSDNRAKDILTQNIDPKYLTEAFSDLGIEFPNKDNYGISAKSYSRFFRRLYNATFLSREFSEKALALLDETTYTKGIVAGVPNGVRVAHKYGENGAYEKGVLRSAELHDCGIVYAKTTYLLCVMTRGYSFQDLQNVIKNVSKIAYENFD